MTAAAPDELVPIPPRYRWLRRVAIAAAGAILVLLVIRIAWGIEARRRLVATLAELDARHEPWLPEQFANEPALPGANAADFYTRAVVASSAQAGTWRFAELAGRGDATLTSPDGVRAILAANTDTLDLIRAGAACENADWRRAATRIPPKDTAGRLSEPRQFNQLLLLQCRAAHRAGDDATAVECLRVALEHSRHVGQDWSLLSYSTETTLDAVTADSIARVAPRLRVSDAPDAADHTCPASRADVAALIARLLDESALDHARRRAALAERAATLDAQRVLAPGAFPRPAHAAAASSLRVSAPNRWLYQPAIELELMRNIERLDAFVQASEMRDAPSARRIAGDDEVLPAHRRYGPAFVLSTKFSIPAFGAILERTFVDLARRRLAAARLALRLYELDRGRPCRDLADLVPDYLAAVPLDPLFDDGRTIALAPDGPDAMLSAGDVIPVELPRAGRQLRHPAEMRLDPPPPRFGPRRP